MKHGTQIAQHSSQPMANLIPRRTRDAAAVRRRVRRWMAYGALYAVGVTGACVVLHAVGGKESSRLANDNGMLAERVAGAQQQLDMIHKQIRVLSRNKEASETVGVHPDWSLLLASLAESRNGDIVLQSIDLRAVEAPKAAPAKVVEGEKPKPKPRAIEDYTVDLKGYGLSQGDVVNFIGRLDRPPLADVRLKESRSQPFRGVSAVAFTAQFRLTEGAAPVPKAPGGAQAAVGTAEAEGEARP